MAYDEGLGERISMALTGYRGVVAKKMFGGICFMLNGRMCCGIVKDDLMIRLAPETAGEMLKKPGVRPMDFTGRPMPGFLYVGPSAIKTEKGLKFWVELSASYALSQPAGPENSASKKSSSKKTSKKSGVKTQKR